MEVIAALLCKSKSPSVSRPNKLSIKTRRRNGCERGTTRTSSNHFHCPVPGRPVISVPDYCRNGDRGYCSEAHRGGRDKRGRKHLRASPTKPVTTTNERKQAQTKKITVSLFAALVSETQAVSDWAHSKGHPHTQRHPHKSSDECGGPSPNLW